MYDIVDELQICSHITQLQAQQLYALVRVAMGLQYKARLRLPSSSSSRRRSIRPIAPVPAIPTALARRAPSLEDSLRPRGVRSSLSARTSISVSIHPDARAATPLNSASDAFRLRPVVRFGSYGKLPSSQAEKSMTQHIFLMTLAAICGAVVPVVVGVQTTLEDKSVAMYMSYAAIALSLLQTLAGTLANVGQFNQNAIMMRMTAAEIKAEIYKFQGLAGEYSDPPDYQVQFPRLMHHLAEFRQKAVVAQFQARGGQDGGSKRNKEEAARKDLDAKMVADGHRGV